MPFGGIKSPTYICFSLPLWPGCVLTHSEQGESDGWLPPLFHDPSSVFLTLPTEHHVCRRRFLNVTRASARSSTAIVTQYHPSPPNDFPNAQQEHFEGLFFGFYSVKSLLNMSTITDKANIWCSILSFTFDTSDLTSCQALSDLQTSPLEAQQGPF